MIGRLFIRIHQRLSRFVELHRQGLLFSYTIPTSRGLSLSMHAQLPARRSRRSNDVVVVGPRWMSARMPSYRGTADGPIPNLSLLMSPRSTYCVWTPTYPSHVAGSPYSLHFDGGGGWAVCAPHSRVKPLAAGQLAVSLDIPMERCDSWLCPCVSERDQFDRLDVARNCTSEGHASSAGDPDHSRCCSLYHTLLNDRDIG
jgi:hypothetical protein